MEVTAGGEGERKLLTEMALGPVGGARRGGEDP